MGKKRLARRGTPGIAAFSFCMLQAAGKLRLRRVPFCLGARSSDKANPSEGGKWHARPARPESSEGLAFSEARGAICASERRCQPRRAGGAWDGLGIRKGRWAAGESSSLHPRPVGREHRTPQGLDEPGQFELKNLFLGRARCQVPCNRGFAFEFRMD